MCYMPQQGVYHANFDTCFPHTHVSENMSMLITLYVFFSNVQHVSPF